MVVPTTAIDSSTGGVRITWTAPYDGGDTITEYKVEIFDSTSAYTVESSACLGTDPTLLSTL